MNIFAVRHFCFRGYLQKQFEYNWKYILRKLADAIRKYLYFAQRDIIPTGVGEAYLKFKKEIDK